MMAAFVPPGGFSYKVTFVSEAHARSSTLKTLSCRICSFFAKIQTALPSPSNLWFSPFCMSEVRKPLRIFTKLLVFVVSV